MAQSKASEWGVEAELPDGWELCAKTEDGELVIVEYAGPRDALRTADLVLAMASRGLSLEMVIPDSRKFSFSRGEGL